MLDCGRGVKSKRRSRARMRFAEPLARSFIRETAHPLGRSLKSASRCHDPFIPGEGEGRSAHCTVTAVREAHTVAGQVRRRFRRRAEAW